MSESGVSAADWHRIDAVCLQYETQRKEEPGGLLEAYLAEHRWPPGPARTTLWLQLAGTELEFLWEATVLPARPEPSAAELPATPVQQLLQATPSLAEMPGDLQMDLALEEFRHAQRMSQPWPVGDYAGRFPAWPLLESRLRAALAEWSPTEVRVRTGDHLELRCDLNLPVVVGRQTQDDPLPCALRHQGPRKLVLASRNDLTMSREHLLLEVPAVDRVRVTNTSRQSEVALPDGGVLKAGESRILRRPLTLQVGRIYLAIPALPRPRDFS